MAKKGITSNEFIRKMEKPKENGISDEGIMQMTGSQFTELAVNSKKISNFTKNLKKRGYTEFSSAWGTKILIDANRKAAQVAGLLDKLQGGIDDREQAQINATVKARGKDNLRYIA